MRFIITYFVEALLFVALCIVGDALITSDTKAAGITVIVFAAAYFVSKLIIAFIKDKYDKDNNNRDNK